MERNFENYTRVTDVLYPFSGLDVLDPEVVQNAADRGTAVHKICESIINGLGEFGVEDHLQGYVESFKKWYDGKKVVVMEERFWDDENKITGQCDLILDDGTLVDLKTSYKPGKTWPVQGNAYWYMASQKYNIKKINFVHLQKKGGMAKVYDYPIDPDLWLSVLRTYNHFYRKK